MSVIYSERCRGQKFLITLPNRRKLDGCQSIFLSKLNGTYSQREAGGRETERSNMAACRYMERLAVTFSASGLIVNVDIC